MTTGLDIVKGALRNINSYQSGEQIAQADQQDCLDTFNDLIDSWSTDKQYIFGSQENVLQWIAGQNQYKVGNPTYTSIGEPPFTGTLTSGSNVITAVTNIPADLKVGTSASQVGAGSTVTDTQNLLPAGTYVTAIGTNTVTLSGEASANSQGSDSFTYTIPGDLPIARPLRITNGFTRLGSLDFTLDVYESESRFLEILYKAQPGPWPVVGWYNNLMPYGVLNVYQTPSASAELHLFTDTILSNLTLTQTVIAPQGYVRAWKWCLARELWPQYWGKEPFPPHMEKLANEALSFIKALNAQPAVTSRYDSILVRGNRPDGGYILHGGYR